MKLILTILMGCMIYSSALAQNEDIFGIDTKLKDRNRRSESNLGNVTRGIIGSIGFELGGGYAQHFSSMDFMSNSPTEYPISSGNPELSPSDIGMGETLKFNQLSSAVPIQAGIKIDMFGIVTLGAGYSREYGNMAALSNDQYEFNFAQEAYVFDKLYGTLGLVLYDARRRIAFLNMMYKKYSSQNTYMQAERKLRMQQDYPWRFVAEGEYGTINIQEPFDPNLTITDPYYGFGLKIERAFSEYTKVFLKPAVELRKFNYNHATLEETQTIEQNLYSVSIGVGIRMPGTKRCKVAGCGVKMKHLHDGVEYRGSSIWNMQNRKVGQWY